MMEHFEQIFSVLRRISLTARERNNIRIRLLAHMQENPLPQSAGARWYSGMMRVFSAIESKLNSPTFVTHPAFAALALAVCVGLGTSYAAEYSLPGQPLYSFKTHVNERVEGAMAFSPAAKTEWNAELTNRRLLEAEELAVTGALSPVAKADIETGINVAVQNFNVNLTLLSAKDDLQAANAQSDLEASLNAHETVLSSLKSKSHDTDTLVSLVRQHAEQVSKDRSVVIAAFAATDTPAVKTAALKQKKSAESAIKRAKTNTKSFSTQVASSVISIATEAEGDVQAGDSDAEKGKWGRAFGAFQDASRKVKETQDTVNTRMWLKTKFGISVVLGEGSEDPTATSTDPTSNNDDEKQQTDQNNSSDSEKGHGSKNNSSDDDSDN